MKQPLLLLLFSCFLYGFALGQISLDVDNLPAPGDTIRLRNVFNPNVSAGSSSSMSQTWDFTSLQSAIGQRQVVRPATEGQASASFPTADVVLIDDLGLETYFITSDNTLTLLGFFGPDPFGLLPIDVLVRYDDPVVGAEAPFSYGELFTDDGAFSLSIAWDQLPAFITDSLDLGPLAPDSIRIEVSQTTEVSADAFGAVQLADAPQGIEVLRIRTQENRTTTVFAVFSFLPPVDITNLLPFDQFGFTPTDTLLSYQFFTSGSPNSVAECTMADDLQTVQTARYNPDITVTSLSPTLLTTNPDPRIQLYPNPVVSEARFQVSGLQPGQQYRIRIHNLLGNTVYEQPLRNAGRTEYNADLGFLPSGTYLYSLSRQDGQLLQTRRMVVLKP